MKQLYANNAITTLSSGITSTSTSLTVADGSTFPSLGSFQYFLCTLELAGAIEILMITARSGNVLTIGGLIDIGQTVAGRGQEGTTAQAFATGTRVECRVTRDSLVKLSTGMYTLSSIDALVSPSAAYVAGFITGTLDPVGNPVTTLRKDDSTWRFLTHTTQSNTSVTASTTTTVTATSVTAPLFATGEWLIQFTSGALTGQVRAVTSVTGNVVTWTTATASAPATSSTFELLRANSAILATAGSGAGAVGGGTDKVFYENDRIITTNYTLTIGKNAITAGPVTINTGITVTIPTGANWAVV